MEKTRSQYHKIAGFLLLTLVLFTVPTVFRQFQSFGGGLTQEAGYKLLLSTALNLATMGIQLWLGLTLLKEKKGKGLTMPIAALTSIKAVQFLLGFTNNRYKRSVYHYNRYSGSYYTDEFSIWLLLPYLMELAAYVLLFWLANKLLKEGAEEQKEKARKLWFLPGVLMAGKFVFNLLSFFLAGHIFSGLWSWVLETAVLFCLGAYLAYPEGMPASEYHGDGYKAMIPHLLLCVFTLGIYQLIWISRVTKYLNARVDSEPPMKPWHQVVAGMFVPFYLVYWAYKSAQRLDIVARREGARSNLTMLCTLLQLFSFANVILPSIFIQDKINTLALLKTGETAPDAPSAQTGPTWGDAVSTVPVFAAPAPVVENPDELPEM